MRIWALRLYLNSIITSLSLTWERLRMPYCYFDRYHQWSSSRSLLNWSDQKHILIDHQKTIFFYGWLEKVEDQLQLFWGHSCVPLLFIFHLKIQMKIFYNFIWYFWFQCICWWSVFNKICNKLYMHFFNCSTSWCCWCHCYKICLLTWITTYCCLWQKLWLCFSTSGVGALETFRHSWIPNPSSQYKQESITVLYPCHVSFSVQNRLPKKVLTSVMEEIPTKILTWRISRLLKGSCAVTLWYRVFQRPNPQWYCAFNRPPLQQHISKNLLLIWEVWTGWGSSAVDVAIAAVLLS